MVELTYAGVWFFTRKTYEVIYDNQSGVKIIENSIKWDRTNHLYINHNFIYKKLENKTIDVPYLKTLEQLVDILTKVVSTKAFDVLTEILTTVG